MLIAGHEKLANSSLSGSYAFSIIYFCYELLVPQVLIISFQILGPNSDLKNGKSCLQRGGFIRDYLQNFIVKRMECPACNPDLNPTEHLWDQLVCAVCSSD